MCYVKLACKWSNWFHNYISYVIIILPTGAPLITKESIFQSKIIHISEVGEKKLFMVIAVVKRLMNWEFEYGMLQ